MRRFLPAALLAAAVVTVAGCGAAPVARVAATTPERDQSVRLQAPQVEVVAYSSRNVRICAGYGVSLASLVLTPNSGNQRVPACKAGLRAVGVDTHALTSHTHGVRWGELHVVGTLDGGIFHVTSQGHPRNATESFPFNAPIPCAAPRGGWHFAMPTMEQEHALSHYFSLAHHHDIVSIAMWHHASILLITSEHVARVRRVLGAFWPRQLCVRKARYSRAVLEREAHQVEALLGVSNKRGAARYGWPTGAGGTTVNRNGQAMTTLEVLIVTPALRDYLRRQPPGLVQVESTFRPVR